MLDLLRQRMSAEGIDWFIVFASDEHLSEYTAESDRFIKYLSGFSGSAGTLLVCADSARLWTDSRYHIQAKYELEGSGIELMAFGNPGVPTLERFLSDHVWNGMSVAFDLKTVSFDYYRLLKKMLPADTVIVDGHDILTQSVDNMPSGSFNPIVSVDKAFAGKSIKEKLSELRKNISGLFPQENSYTYLLSDLTDIMWLFNLRGSDIDHVPAAVSYAMITSYSATVYLHKKQLDENSRKSLEEEDVIIKEYSRFYRELDDIATDVVIADECGNNCRMIRPFFDQGIHLNCRNCDVITKAVKNAAEIQGMKNAHIKDAVTLTRFIMYLKKEAQKNDLPDEYVLGRMLDEKRIEGGCCDTSFATICAYGKNSAIVHYVADKEKSAKVEDKGFLLIDSGGHYRFEGTTDVTRTISLGPLTDEEKKVYTTVLKGNLRLMDAMFPEGCEGTLLDMLAEQPLWESGYYCGHGIGHGVGCFLSVHESEARISRRTGKRDIPLRPGVIISDEPGVYLEGKFGVRLENLLLVVKDKAIDSHPMCRFEPLTLVPFDKESIDLTLLDEREKKLLDDYNSLVYDKMSPLLDDEERQWLKEATLGCNYQTV